MSCGEFPGELLSAYQDGELDAEDEQVVRQHLVDCPACREELAKLRKTRQLLQSIPDRPVPKELRAQLKERLMANQCQAGFETPTGTALLPSRRRRSPSYVPSLAVAAAVVLVLLLPVLALVGPFMGPIGTDMTLRTDGPDPTPEAADPDPGMAALEEEAASDASAFGSTLVIGVPDVAAAQEQAVTRIRDQQGEVTGVMQTWDDADALIRVELEIEVSPEGAAALQSELADLGSVLYHQFETETPAIDELLARGRAYYPTTPSQFSVHFEELTAPMPVDVEPETFGRQLHRNVADSWERFGKSVASTLLWVAAHLPHLAFLIGLSGVIIWVIARFRS